MRSLARVTAIFVACCSFEAFAAELPPAPRTIVLVRHGEYVPDPKEPALGPGLSPLGIAQAKLAGARLAAMPDRFDAIYSSPLTRARETAMLIAADLGLQNEVLPALEECTPKTRRSEVIAKERPEDMTACAAGLDAFVRERFVPARGTPRREVMVAHGNVIRYLTTRALGVDTEAWLEMSIGHVSFTTILIEPDGRFRLIALGDIGHLPPNLQTGAAGMSSKALAVPK